MKGLQDVAEKVLTKLRVQPTHSEMGKLRSREGECPGHTVI